MNYYKADDKQLEEISSIYSNAIIAMDNDGICQWDEIYPSKQIITEDIRKRQMYIGKESNKIAICFVLSEEYDEEYKNVLVGYSVTVTRNILDANDNIIRQVTEPTGIYHLHDHEIKWPEEKRMRDAAQAVLGLG